MTDKELLELAAKAAEMQIVGEVNKMIAQPDHRTGGFVIRNDRGGDFCWNPLTDDGDALRLAVKCSIDFWFDDDCHVVGTTFMVGDVGYNTEESWRNGDKLEATRRAITRAAAEIGSAM